MKWDLSFCVAEIEGNELSIQLKGKRRSIEHLFKVYGEYFKFRSILENFGYNIFKKVLKRQILLLTPERIEQFKTFFSAIQAKETGANPTIDARYSDPKLADSWLVDATAKPTIKGDRASYCANCGVKLPVDLGDARFCPECGESLES